MEPNQYLAIAIILPVFLVIPALLFCVVGIVWELTYGDVAWHNWCQTVDHVADALCVVIGAYSALFFVLAIFRFFWTML